LIQLHVVLSGDSKGLLVRGERVVGNWRVKEVVNLRSGHGEVTKYDRRSSLLSMRGKHAGSGGSLNNTMTLSA
jgi:hypothetical protein